MSKLLAVVRLAPGQVAFYDETTGTHLTMGNPMAEVYDHMNTARIKRAVQNKILNLVTGSFNVKEVEQEKKSIDVQIPTPTPAKIETVDKVVVPDKIVESIPEEKIEESEEQTEEATEENVDETIEEVEIESKPKSKRKKKED